MYNTKEVIKNIKEATVRVTFCRYLITMSSSCFILDSKCLTLC